MLDYTKAIDLLRYPATWCRGASLLAKIGKREALVPLLRAYEIPTEASKSCLLDAMESLNAKLGAFELYNRDDADERRLAVHLMELFPDEDYLSLLEQAVVDNDLKVLQQARRTLACQLQTPAWEALMIRLLDADEEATRAQAIESLSRRRTNTARDALRNRLARETNEALKKKLQASLSSNLS